ncbi:MAG TPA: signal peptidase I [Candidatus Excrementavichristensenella intestinipullorum]|nr:signal peptidase I [Candidatus Excrementavichristensenella intestinipullorum]
MSYRYDEDYEDVPARRVKKPAGEGAQRGGEKRAARKASPSSGASSRKGDAKAAAGKARPSSKAAKPAPEGGAKKRPAPSGAARKPRHRYPEEDYAPRPKRPSGRKKGRKRRTNPITALLYWVLALALAFGISYFVREYCFEIVRVSGDNMYETLMDGDLALVTKFDYQSETPQRGDVVAVELGGNQGYVLRRVVGLPGETVEIVGGETLINGSKLLESYIGLATYDTFDGKTLPSGKYYLLGDNRTETNDSRSSQIGLVDQEDIVGKVRWVIWPLSHLGSL